MSALSMIYPYPCIEFIVAVKQEYVAAPNIRGAGDIYIYFFCTLAQKTDRNN